MRGAAQDLGRVGASAASFAPASSPRKAAVTHVWLQ